MFLFHSFFRGVCFRSLFTILNWNDSHFGDFIQISAQKPNVVTSTTTLTDDRICKFNNFSAWTNFISSFLPFYFSKPNVGGNTSIAEGGKNFEPHQKEENMKLVSGDAGGVAEAGFTGRQQVGLDDVDQCGGVVLYSLPEDFGVGTWKF